MLQHAENVTATFIAAAAAAFFSFLFLFISKEISNIRSKDTCVKDLIGMMAGDAGWEEVPEDGGSNG